MKKTTPFNTIILAAGKGTRMKSDLPKVLHRIAGKAIIEFPMMAASNAGAKRNIVVVGHGADLVKEALAGFDVDFVIQHEQLGTGHAVKIAEEALTDRQSPVVILCGDAPLIASDTIAGLVSKHVSENNCVTVLTADFDDPTGYGRIIKDGAGVHKIVEEKDATSKEKAVREVNSGAYCVDGAFLFDALARINTNNAQKEYYLTDIVSIGKNAGKSVGWAKTGSANEITGINSRKELAVAGKLIQRAIIDDLMNEGVSIPDPDTVSVDHGVIVGKDTTIHPQVRLEGQINIADNVLIENGAVIKNTTIGTGSHIKPYCVISDSIIHQNTAIGPFAHLRPGCEIGSGAKAGNFVEIKKSTLGHGAKVSHLTYIGDSSVGEDVNIGAGTVTCNYDGYEKFQTVIEDGVFVGSGTNIVAPVTIGSEAVIGAGSTITKDVPSDALALTRPEQKTIDMWAKKRRDKKGGK